MHLSYVREVASNLYLLIHLLIYVSVRTGTIISIPMILAAEKLSRWDVKRMNQRQLVKVEASAKENNARKAS